MNIDVTLTDAEGRESRRVEKRRWLLRLVSSYLEQGREVEIRAGGGTVAAVREGSPRQQRRRT